MRPRRGVVVMLATWVAVVLVGATAVWAVISRAGEDLVTSASQPVLSAAASSPATTVAPSSRPLEHRPRKPKSSRPTPEVEPTPSASPSTVPSSSPPPPSSAPSSSGGGSTPSQPPAPPSSKTGTWNGKPGTVSMTCRSDGRRGNYSVYARSGWVAETEQEDGGIEVHFHRQGGEGEVELKAACVGGRPVFREDGDD